MSEIHLGHVFHIAGEALVSIPDGALVVDDAGHIVFCGEQSAVPDDHAAADVHDHRPGSPLPGFVDTHLHFPETYAGDSYGGGQLLEWLNSCIFPCHDSPSPPSRNGPLSSSAIAG